MSRPWGENLWPKFEILTVFGDEFLHFCPDKREIWYGGGRSPVPNFTFIGAMCRPCGAKTPFLDGPLSKCNTGMAALGSGLPVKRQNTRICFLDPTKNSLKQVLGRKCKYNKLALGRSKAVAKRPSWLPRDATCISAAYATVRCLSVRPSRSFILSKRINISSNFFTFG